MGAWKNGRGSEGEEGKTGPEGAAAGRVTTTLIDLIALMEPKYTHRQCDGQTYFL